MKQAVVDASIWIELLNKGKKYKKCHDEFQRLNQVFVPSTVIFEVYRKIAKTMSESDGLEAVAQLQQYDVLDFTATTALTAADISLAHQLSMADSIVYAHALDLECTLLTLDNDFRGLPQAHIL